MVVAGTSPTKPRLQEGYYTLIATACTVLLIHGGGFMLGTPENTYAGETIRAMPNVQVIDIDYPLGNVPAAYDYARKVAAYVTEMQGRRPAAYGESAGGAIAGWLAAREDVRGAVSVGAPMNLRAWDPDYDHWLGIDDDDYAWYWSTKRIYSGQRYVRQFHFELDAVVPKTSQRMSEADWRLLEGGAHIELPAWRTRNAVEAVC
jgi:acetyl esterase/lipase